MKPRIYYLGSYFWISRTGTDSPNQHGWFVHMNDGSYWDYSGAYPSYRDFGPFATLREAYHYAAPTVDHGDEYL